MRLILLALLPAALAACGNEPAQTGDTMPAPSQSDPAEATDTASVETPAVNTQTMDGVWVTADDRGDPSAMFGPENSEAVFKVICRSSSVEGEGNSLVFQRAISGEAAGDTLDFLTSAGNGSIDIVPLDMETPMVGGSLDPASNVAATLANADGALRVRTSSDEIVIPLSDEMQTVVDDCRPEPAMAEDTEAMDDEDMSEETGD
ncbi:hypothetical protein [Henriciella litoralis]|uniref:hypothetical protein n=1 Tax=Henriciella litoralis TaxID=568102 RepID=UPI000A00D171|nr:hypothetical protein [Henriciella litoralis]